MLGKTRRKIKKRVNGTGDGQCGDGDRAGAQEIPPLRRALPAPWGEPLHSGKQTEFILAVCHLVGDTDINK